MSVVTAGEDYRSLDSAVLDLLPRERVATVSVEILSDELVEGSEIFTVSLQTRTTEDSIHVDHNIATITILDS